MNRSNKIIVIKKILKYFFRCARRVEQMLTMMFRSGTVLFNDVFHDVFQKPAPRPLLKLEASKIHIHNRFHLKL